MTPLAYVQVFAWISIVALSMTVFSDFWLPMLVGGTAVMVLSRFTR